MAIKPAKKSIALLGGGPGGLFMYKRLIESGNKNLDIHIFERKAFLGSGMPYSREGANEEHVTNVSDNEIPVIFSSIEEWLKIAPKQILKKYKIDPDRFNQYKVLPRLFFGEYLSAQFELLRLQAEKTGVFTKIHLNSNVTDIEDDPSNQVTFVEIDHQKRMPFDFVVICTGHNWPRKYEGTVPNYFDSPYPPSKLALELSTPIAIRGASLTAIDAVRTLARHNGHFREGADGKIFFELNKNSGDFRLVMHSRDGLLPAIRFHLEDSHLSKSGLLSKKKMIIHAVDNEGFISLDFVFENDFKKLFIEKDPDFYQQIKNMNLESFVDSMMAMRENKDAFELFKEEYLEAEESIQKRKSIYWKEMLAVLSFAMNYPAKYLSAEDMLRLQKVLMPLISIVIAFVPQSSCRELMALHDAGVLTLVAVGEDSRVIPNTTGGAMYRYTREDGTEVKTSFEVFVDCIGQPHLSFKDFPFRGLVAGQTISQSKVRFKSNYAGAVQKDINNLVELDPDGYYYLKVPGITINDKFQVLHLNGQQNERIYVMAVPYIGGYNPDYSGLDFCEAASESIIKSLNETLSVA
jgi:uncharacterized NAD(P)/FAD-binding protein YdhS